MNTKKPRYFSAECKANYDVNVIKDKGNQDSMVSCMKVGGYGLYILKKIILFQRMT